jgi:hypothetical protein
MKSGKALLRLCMLTMLVGAILAFQAVFMPMQNVRADGGGWVWCSDGGSQGSGSRTGCSVHFDGARRDENGHCLGLYHYVCGPNYEDVYCEYDYGSGPNEYCDPLEY